uniref:SOS response-associated peptidase n=1 Tax=Ralstonia solanacearum TaxID=305 RepID=A0A0S4X0E0_RALSL|nr:protein of unknown function [Ralstonia solanacearum]
MKATKKAADEMRIATNKIAAAGHDRCPVAIKAENIDAWLNPNPSDLECLDAILEAPERPYYQHRVAA